MENFSVRSVQLEEYITLPTCSGMSSSTSIRNISSTPETKHDYKWSTNDTKLLIDLYAKYKKYVGTFQIRNNKALWSKIAEELGSMQVNVNANNCLNRWRVIERNYKKYIDNQRKTGRGRKYFEYEAEMKEIFEKKTNLHPQYLLGVERSVETENPGNLDQEEVEESHDNAKNEVENVLPTLSKKCNNENVKKSEAMKKRLTTIEKLRMDRKEYYTQRLDIERSKLEQMKKRNELIENRNNILKEIKCNSNCLCNT